MFGRGKVQPNTLYHDMRNLLVFCMGTSTSLRQTQPAARHTGFVFTERCRSKNTRMSESANLNNCLFS